MKGALYIRTLGGLVVERGGQPCEGAAAQRKHLGLLALLAAAGDRGITRDKLVAFLWPERESDSARHLLHQACYALRRELDQPEMFLTTADLLRLNTAAVISDVWVFRNALVEGQLANAVGVYGGPFLDGFYLTDGGEFERWAGTERADLHQQVTRALRQLAISAGQDDRRAAVDWWRRLTVLEPLSADAAVGLMTALAAIGERAQAIQFGRGYCTLVRDELDTAPARAVAELLEKLRQQSSGARPPLKRDPPESGPR